MDLDNLLNQLGIFLSARAGVGLAVGPVVIAAGRNFQGLVQRANGMLGCLAGGHFADVGIVLRHGRVVARLHVIVPQLHNAERSGVNVRLANVRRGP